MMEYFPTNTNSNLRGCPKVDKRRRPQSHEKIIIKKKKKIIAPFWFDEFVHEFHPSSLHKIGEL